LAEAQIQVADLIYTVIPKEGIFYVGVQLSFHTTFPIPPAQVFFLPNQMDWAAKERSSEQDFSWEGANISGGLISLPPR